MQRVVLEDGETRVSLLSLGARTQDWTLATPAGPRPVILGHPDPDAYRHDPYFLGAIVGRVANRIGGAAYDGHRLVANDGPHQLHGGPGGLWAVNWRLEAEGPRRARFSYRSPEGEMGFPGTVDFTVTVTLDGTRLTYDMRALPDRETPVSLAQHNYYRLGAAPRGRICADRRLARDGAGIMGGDVLPAGPLDLREGGSLPVAADDFLVFEKARDPDAPVAELRGDGLRLRMWSDQPGAQLYSGHNLGAPFTPRDGLCLEPSGYPNAVNVPGFPSVMASPERPYRQVLSVTIEAD